MKIILAAGIYPPDIGGPATYSRALAQELQKLGHDVAVVTYGRDSESGSDMWSVIRVPKSGGPLLRWWRYSRALRKHAANADIVYAFSSMSCGVPLRLARLSGPKKILRLGGDFLWERYTDKGGQLGLREWYGKGGRGLLVAGCWLLKHFDHVVFSSAFQRDIYLDHYKRLPAYSVLENAVPPGIPTRYEKHSPLRLLFLGRLVGFKNLASLVSALKELPRATLTVAGSGPLLDSLCKHARALNVADRVAFVGNRDGAEKQKLFHEHDVLVLPSFTEISPNTAIEARSVGMPVLLAQENGLSTALQKGMLVRDLHDCESIVSAVREVERKYEDLAESSAEPALRRPWSVVAEEHLTLFQSVLCS